MNEYKDPLYNHIEEKDESIKHNTRLFARKNRNISSEFSLFLHIGITRLCQISTNKRLETEAEKKRKTESIRSSPKMYLTELLLFLFQYLMGYSVNVYPS